MTLPGSWQGRWARALGFVLVFVLLGQVLPAEWRVPGLGKTPVAAAEPVAPPAAVVPERTVRQVSDPGPTVVSGTLAKDTVWGPLGSPYVIRGDFAVPAGVALTLLQGRWSNSMGSSPVSSSLGS